jgi:hypothetical protein
MRKFLFILWCVGLSSVSRAAVVDYNTLYYLISQQTTGIYAYVDGRYVSLTNLVGTNNVYLLSKITEGDLYGSNYVVSVSGQVQRSTMAMGSNAFVQRAGDSFTGVNIRASSTLGIGTGATTNAPCMVVGSEGSHIANSMQAPYSIITTMGIIAYPWGVTTYYEDNSSVANHAVPVSSVSIDSSGMKVGTGCLRFDANGGSAYAPHITEYSTMFSADSSSYSINLWVKKPNLIGPSLIYKVQYGYNPQFYFKVDNPTTLAVNLYVETSGPKLYSGTNLTITLTEWHMYSVSRNGVSGDYVFYLDGEQVGTANSTAVIGYNGNPLYFGSDGDTQLSTELDEVTIWSKALSDAEITSLYNGGSGRKALSSESGLKGSWSFDSANAPALRSEQLQVFGKGYFRDGAKSDGIILSSNDVSTKLYVDNATNAAINAASAVAINTATNVAISVATNACYGFSNVFDTAASVDNKTNVVTRYAAGASNDVLTSAKNYTDSIGAALSTFYLRNSLTNYQFTGSMTNYFQLSRTFNGVRAWTNSFLVPSNNHYIVSYVTVVSNPVFTRLISGRYVVEFDAWYSGTANPSLTVKPEVYVMDNTNGMIHEFEDNEPVVLTSAKVHHRSISIVPNNYIMQSSDRLVIRFKATAVAGNGLTFHISTGKEDLGLILVSEPNANYVRNEELDGATNNLLSRAESNLYLTVASGNNLTNALYGSMLYYVTNRFNISSNAWVTSVHSSGWSWFEFNTIVMTNTAGHYYTNAYAVGRPTEPAPITGSVDLHGGDDVALGSSLNINSTFSISTWVYPSVLVNYAGIVSQTSIDKDDGSPAWMVVVHNDGTIGASTDGEWVFSEAAGIEQEKWFHCVWVYTNATYYFYVDGASKGSASSLQWIDLNTNIFVGSWYGTPGYDFEGKIDELVIWKNALSSTEISDMYNYGTGVYGKVENTPYSKAIAGYHFDDAEGTKAMASSEVLLGLYEARLVGQQEKLFRDEKHMKSYITSIFVFMLMLSIFIVSADSNFLVLATYRKPEKDTPTNKVFKIKEELFLVTADTFSNACKKVKRDIKGKNFIFKNKTVK